MPKRSELENNTSGLPDVNTATNSAIEEQKELDAFVQAGTTPSFARVIRKIHAIDPEVEYDSLIKHLDPDPARTEFGVAYAYADAAESKARKALQLMAVARIEQKAFEHHKAQLEAEFRREALAQLQREKDGGERTKQITDADVKSKMMEMFGDDIGQLEDQGQRVENAVDVTTDLAKLAASRCKTAQTMLGSVRR